MKLNRQASARAQNPSWIRDGEKFALVGLSVQIDPALDRFDLPGGLTILPHAAFELPDHWREWLGTIRVEDVEECSLFLVAKKRSAEPSVLDGDNQELQARVGHWLMGLILDRSFSPYSEPFLATGSRMDGEIDVRSFGRLDPPARTIVADHRPITVEQLGRAALIGEQLATYAGPWQHNDWRLLRCLEIYRRARNDNDILERIHQFTRCIEGLIAPMKMGEVNAKGKPNKLGTRTQFKRRTELFIGPRHHDLTGELYEVRSDIEHLHEYKHLEARDRPTRVRLAKLEAIAEFVARSCLARIILEPALAVHFGSVAALDQFWTKPDDERRAIWGDPVDPLAPLAGFRFDHVSDEEFGARP